MFTIKGSTLLTAGAFALSAGLATPALAQEYGDPMQQQQAPQMEVNDEQVSAFAEAQARVVEIGEKWSPRLEAAETAEEMQEAQQSAQQEMIVAVENSGLSVEEYNQIAQAAQADEALRERILSQ